MFDLSWTECLFVAALAIIVVGPKDLPRLARTVGSIMQKGRRMYRDAVDSVHRLEQEIDLAGKPAEASRGDDHALLPEEVRSAMTMESPHRDAQEHRRANAAYEKAMSHLEPRQHGAAPPVSSAPTGDDGDTAHEH